MKYLKFEYKITIIYTLIGGLWILFSDKLLHFLTKNNVILERELQTFKGWFYILVTAILFFLFVKRHLEKLRVIETDLKNHKDHLQELVDEKTIDLANLNNQLTEINKELTKKSELITLQNNELKETLRNLQITQSRLLQADKMASLGVLTAGVAHEINNPLNFIMGAYDVLENYFEEYGSSDQKKTNLLLQSIKTGIDRTIEIVQGLNEFSRNNEAYDENCDIHKILNNCLMILFNQTKGRIEIKKTFYKDKLSIVGNAGKLHQVFINILTNSIQAIENKGIIEISTEKTENEIIIQVLDNGSGISNDNLKKIVEPFFTTKPPGKGTGLGLSIVYSILEDHQGVIAYESELGKWTRATIKFRID